MDRSLPGEAAGTKAVMRGDRYAHKEFLNRLLIVQTSQRLVEQVPPETQLGPWRLVRLICGGSDYASP
jgi:hypothetical protein